MAEIDLQNSVFRDDQKTIATGSNTTGAGVSRREKRAQITRAQALSPVRILTQVMLLPVVTLSVTLSIYTRTSPYERTDALRHLAALAGCNTAAAMDLAPAFAGGLGYHARNDPDGDGIACDQISPGKIKVSSDAKDTPVTGAPVMASGGAKFIKP